MVVEVLQVGLVGYQLVNADLTRLIKLEYVIIIERLYMEILGNDIDMGMHTRRVIMYSS